MNTVVLVVVLLVILGACTAIGMVGGRWVRSRAEAHRATIGAVQGALLGLVGLLLAFGLTMAVGRYQDRRSFVIREADDLGTTYLRAQLLAEPARTSAMTLLRQYADTSIVLAHERPDSASFRATSGHLEDLQQQLWAVAGDAVHADPLGNASRLFTESLNNTIDRHADRLDSLRNRVPTPVLILMLIGSCAALTVLATYLTLLGRSIIGSIASLVLVFLIVFVSFDLDRPDSGFIRVPATPLQVTRATMDRPPAVGGRQP
jgi:hypothetical protein